MLLWPRMLGLANAAGSHEVVGQFTCWLPGGGGEISLTQHLRTGTPWAGCGRDVQGDWASNTVRCQPAQISTVGKVTKMEGASGTEAPVPHPFPSPPEELQPLPKEVTPCGVNRQGPRP